VLIVVTEFVEKVKTEMKQESKRIADEIKMCKKWHKEDVKKLKEKHKKENVPKVQTDKKIGELVKDTNLLIAKLTYKADFYSTSKMLPVRVYGVVINFKIYSDFMKKIEGFYTNITMQDGEVNLSYWKEGARNHGKGVLKLYDLSEYFKDFKHIPEARRVDPYGQEA
jgi:hypothetical protein